MRNLWQHLFWRTSADKVVFKFTKKDGRSLSAYISCCSWRCPKFVWHLSIWKFWNCFLAQSQSWLNNCSIRMNKVSLVYHSCMQHYLTRIHHVIHIGSLIVVNSYEFCLLFLRYIRSIKTVFCLPFGMLMNWKKYHSCNCQSC